MMPETILRGAVVALFLGMTTPAEAQTASLPGDASASTIGSMPGVMAKFRLQDVAVTFPDLTLILPAERPNCDIGQSDAIVVCGRREADEHNRMRPLTRLQPFQTVGDFLIQQFTNREFAAPGRALGLNVSTGKPNPWSDRLPPRCKQLNIGSTRC